MSHGMGARHLMPTRGTSLALAVSVPGHGTFFARIEACQWLQGAKAPKGGGTFAARRAPIYPRNTKANRPHTFRYIAYLLYAFVT